MNKVARFALLALGIVFIILGILRGELAEIMQKGATICLECIGIG
jgi:hypothetical protein